jgi:AcrR family transcriptional regulator
MVSPIRPSLREKYERRRLAVVRTAARVFAERGYRQTSIDDLVEATGLQRGGLYHYIDGKQQLLLLIHDELMGPLLERIEPIVAAGGDPEQQLRDVMRAWVAHVAEHRDHMTVFTEERRLLESDPEWKSVRDARDRFRDLLAGLLSRGAAKGTFEVSDPEIALLSILGIVNHMAVWFDPHGRLAPVEVADRCVDLLLEGLRPR